MPLLLACLCLAGATACASGGGGLHGSAGSPFPTRSQVDALTHGTGAVSPFVQAVVDAESWTFSEPAAEQLDDASYVDPSPWGKLVDEYVASDPTRVRGTRAMYCSARELSRFYLQYSALPAMPLRNAILEHCGALVADAVPSFVFGSATSEKTDEMLHYEWKSKARQLLYEYSGTGPRNLGIAFARDAKKAVVVALSGARRAQLEPMSRIAGADGRIQLRGRALLPVAHMSALVNQGRYGFAECEPDDKVRLPEFAYTCALGPGDRGARIAVAAFEPGRISGKELFTIEAVRETAEREYRQVTYTDDAQIRDLAELPPRLLELVNEVRRQASLPAVTLSDTETATATKLASRYFEGFADSAKQDSADVIMLGLMAGWDVGGAPIRSAGFTAAAVGPTDDASDWIACVMADPTGRAALLAPRARVVAFGPVLTKSPAMIAATFTSYMYFDPADYAEVRGQLLEKIRAARAERGLGPPIVVTTLDADAAPLAEELRAGRTTPTGALTALVQTGSQVLGRTVQGYIITGTSVDAVELPEELVSAKRLELSITVTHYRPEDSPWGQFVVLLLIPREGTRA
jgi:hypothetical protein